MKRKWRIGRVILAVLLLCLAGVGFYAWPRGPRWQVEREQALGFDLKQGLLFTINGNKQQSNDQCELHGLDLATGERRISKSIDLKGANWVFPTQCSAVLSADCSTIACYVDIESSIQVFDVRQECKRLFIADQFIIDSIGLSSHGELLAINSLERVYVWDCRTGQIKYQQRISGANKHYSRMELFRSHTEYLQFSDDGRYLAVGSDEDCVVVFDMLTGREIGKCPDSRIPLFLPDSRTLIAMPDILGAGKVQWYQIEEEAVKPLTLSRDIDPLLERLVGTSPKQFLTVREWDSAPGRTLPTWIPVSLRDRVNAALDWTKHTLYIQSISNSTGLVRDEFPLRVNSFVECKITPDGLLLAMEEYDSLSLWDLPPRRSLTCWLICSSLAAFALWIGYPRRQKVVAV
ncbi:MAG: WD40 repeat domain-containing protein [Gemmatales bacterium]